MDIFAVAGPSEPKDTNGEENTTDDGWWKTPLGDRHVVVGGELLVVARLEDDHVNTGKQLSDDHAEEGKAADTLVEAVDLLEDLR